MQFPHNSPLFYEGAINIDWQGFGSLQYPHISGVAVTDTAGGFSCTDNGVITAGNFVTLYGPKSGTGSIVGYTNLTQGTPYKVAASPAPTNTAFTLLDVNGNPITTVAGTLSGVYFEYQSVASPNPQIGSEIKISQNNLRPVVNMSDYNIYECLWVQATDTTRGFLASYLNGSLVGYAAGAPQPSWNKYNPALQPPSVLGADAGSVLDISNMVFIFGTDVTCPMQISMFEVWQASGAHNIVQ